VPTFHHPLFQTYPCVRPLLKKELTSLYLSDFVSRFLLFSHGYTFQYFLLFAGSMSQHAF
ncbi:MAG: hypothetical protein ACLTXS_08995, partial [[Clostridium] symbiosum]